MSFVELKPAAFKALPTREAGAYISQWLGDLRTRVSVLWKAHNHAVDVINLRNDLQAATVRINAVSTRWSVAELEKSFQTLQALATRLRKLESFYFHRTPERKKFDVVIAGYETMITDITGALNSMREWSTRLSNLYDNNGSNREFVQGINACRMFAQSLEALKAKMVSVREEVQDRAESGSDLKMVEDLLKFSRRGVDEELNRVEVHTRGLKKLAARYDLKRQVLKDTGMLAQWQPNVQREIAVAGDDPEIADACESALMFGATGFPDPATDILAETRRLHELADLKSMVAGLIRSAISEIGRALPSVTATVSAVHSGTDDCDDQTQIVQAILLRYISSKAARDISGWDDSRISDLRKALLAASAKAAPVYRTRVLAWVKHYVP